MSPANWPRPVTSGGSSSRVTDCPMKDAFCAAVIETGSLRRLHGDGGSCRRAFERPARHRENEIAAKLGAVDDVVHWLDGGHGRLGGRAKCLVARCGAGEGSLRLDNAPRIDLGGADRQPRLGNLAAVEPVDPDGCGEREVAGAPAELVKAAARAGRQ